MQYLHFISILFLLFTFSNTYAVKAYFPQSTAVDSIQAYTLSTEIQELKLDTKKKRPNKLKTVLLKMLIILLILAFITFPFIGLGLVLLSWISTSLGVTSIVTGIILSIWLIVIVLMNAEKRQKRRQARKERRQAKRTQRKAA
ncbi:MAG: hypothetical protein AAGI49_04995 [Bacteroidota bacterium]